MIRKARIDDVQVLNSLGEKLLANFTKTYNLTNYINDKNYLILVNEDMFINGFLLISENASAYELEAIFVLEEDRQKGIASNLIKYFIDNYYQNHKDIFLEVATNNIKALKLYQKFAFEIVNTRPKYYENIDAYVMKRVEK